MRRPCALGSTCASAATSFGRQRAAVAAMRIDGWLGAGVRKCERMPTRSSRRRRVRLEGEPCRGSTFDLEPRPRACTPGAMDARNWSRLMCLETQGTRGGGPALVLDGMAEGLTHTQLGSTYVSDFTRWACRWRRLRRGAYRMGVQVETWGSGTGPANEPEVRRGRRRPGLRNTVPSTGRVCALGLVLERGRSRISNFSQDGTTSVLGQ